MSGMAPDKGAGVVPIVYMIFPPFVGGVHSIVTLACSIPYTMLLTITSRGGPNKSTIQNQREIKGLYISSSLFFILSYPLVN